MPHDPDALPPSSLARSRRYSDLYFGTLPPEDAPRVLDVVDVSVSVGKKKAIQAGDRPDAMTMDVD